MGMFLVFHSLVLADEFHSSSDNARKAVQYVTLVGKTQVEAFAPQIGILRALDDLAQNSVRAAIGPPERSDGAINLRRHVFTRVRAPRANPE